jgi:hypothetical protein
MYIHTYRYTYGFYESAIPFRYDVECQELGPHVVPAGLLGTPDTIQGCQLQRLVASRGGPGVLTQWIQTSGAIWGWGLRWWMLYSNHENHWDMLLVMFFWGQFSFGGCMSSFWGLDRCGHVQDTLYVISSRPGVVSSNHSTCPWRTGSNKWTLMLSWNEIQIISDSLDFDRFCMLCRKPS